MLTVGIPKEVKALEKRVGLTPAGAAALTRQGIRVLVEKRAGEASGFSDENYRSAGAELSSSAEEVYRQSGLIQKIKEPLPPEYACFRPGLIIFSFLHLAAPAACDLVQNLRRQKVTALAYETLEKNGTRPLLAPMSEIAGALASLYAAFFLGAGLPKPGLEVTRPADALEKIALVYPEIPSGLKTGQTLIFGGGIAGAAAARYALAMGGETVLIEKNPERRLVLQKDMGLAGHCRVLDPSEVTPHMLSESDIWIGAVHQTGSRAAHVLESAAMEEASRIKRKIVMDISIDQGGNFIQARPTSYEIPYYYDSWGNLRFCVPNIPSMAGGYASVRMTDLSLPYTLALVQGLEHACRMYPELRSSINTCEGVIQLEAVRRAHNL